MAGKHTPTPWAVEAGTSVIWGPAPSHDTREWGASLAEARVTFSRSYGRTVSREEADANAEFIVRACNSHDELLEALNLMVSNFAGLLNDDDHDRVHAAIAKAKGEDGEASNG